MKESNRPAHTQKIYTALYALLKSLTGRSMNPTQIDKVQKQSEEFVKAIEEVAREVAIEAYHQSLERGREIKIESSNSTRMTRDQIQD